MPTKWTLIDLQLKTSSFNRNQTTNEQPRRCSAGRWLHPASLENVLNVCQPTSCFHLVTVSTVNKHTPHHTFSHHGLQTTNTASHTVNTDDKFHCVQNNPMMQHCWRHIYLTKWQVFTQSLTGQKSFHSTDTEMTTDWSLKTFYIECCYHDWSIFALLRTNLAVLLLQLKEKNCMSMKLSYHTIQLERHSVERIYLRQWFFNASKPCVGSE